MQANCAFPLDYILSLCTISADHLLPLLEPYDLAKLEIINKACHEAIQKNELWRTMVAAHLRDHQVATRIFAALQVDKEILLDEAPKRLFAILVLMQRNIARNLKEKKFTPWSFTCKDAVDDNDADKYYRAIAIHNKERIFFAAHDKNVDVLMYEEGEEQNAGLNLSHHVSWGQAEAEDAEEETIITRELDLYARFINVRDDLLFIAHFSGTITVWNWKKGVFLTKFRGHLLRNSFASPIKLFKVDGRIIAIGFVDGYVAILQLKDDELQLQGYIDPKSREFGDVRALDISDGRLAVAYDDAIVVWDAETMTEISSISWENEHLVELYFNNKRQKILVGNIFGNEFYMIDLRRGEVDRFFMPDDATMTTISTDWRHHVVAGTWEASIYAWNIDEEEPSKSVKIYQSDKPSVRHISQRSYRASGIDHLTFDGVYLTFIEHFGTNVKLLDLTGQKMK